MFKKRRKKLRNRLYLASAVTLCFILSVMVDNSIKEVVSPMAIKNAEIVINNEVNEAIGEILNDEAFDYSSFVELSFDGNDVKSIKTKTTDINCFKALAIRTIEAKLLKHSTISASVQIGNIINSSILSNRGPSLHILYDLGCSVNAKFETEFISAGVNQTLHILKLCVVTDAYLSIFCDRTNTKVKTDYIIGETVIVGDVPIVYENISS